jgi:hypothetical protein
MKFFQIFIKVNSNSHDFYLFVLGFLVGAKEETSRLDLVSVVYESEIPTIDDLLDTVRGCGKPIFIKSKLLDDLRAAQAEPPLNDDPSVDIKADSITSLNSPDKSVHRSQTYAQVHAEDETGVQV